MDSVRSAAAPLGWGWCKSRLISGMTHNTDRILTTHAGSLPRPPQLRQIVLAASRGETVDATALNGELRSGIAAVVRKQVECGLDSINDGELPKSSFTEYVRSRISGYEMVPVREARRL